MIYASDRIKIDYYEKDEHIIYIQVVDRWTWEDAHIAIKEVNDHIARVEHDIYTIYHFDEHVSIVPKGSAFANLRYLVSTDYDHERLLLFVGVNPLLRKFLDIVGKVYGLRQVLAKYRFVATLEEALTLVRADRVSRGAQIS